VADSVRNRRTDGQTDRQTGRMRKTGNSRHHSGGVSVSLTVNVEEKYQYGLMNFLRRQRRVIVSRQFQLETETDDDCCGLRETNTE